MRLRSDKQAQENRYFSWHSLQELVTFPNTSIQDLLHKLTHHVEPDRERIDRYRDTAGTRNSSFLSVPGPALLSPRQFRKLSTLAPIRPQTTGKTQDSDTA